jgi:iron complex outermembrane receptor protein
MQEGMGMIRVSSRKYIAGVVSLSALLWASAASAQETQTAQATPPAAQTAATAGQIPEVTVTAQKRSESTKDIPVSITAVTGDNLKEQHIDNVEDLTRAAPSISFGAGGTGAGAGEGLDNIEIRGISSTSGSATVGVYLDEVSITVPNYYDGMTQPQPFDIQRLEILRGPQGTLYGASSMGGTVRFITNKPDLDTYSTRVTGDVSGTMHGGVNYDGSFVTNMPIVAGKLAVRFGADYGADAGWIDSYNSAPAPGIASVLSNINPASVVVPPGYTLNANGRNVESPFIGQTPTTLNRSGTNDERHGVFKFSALLKTEDDWTFTPSVWLQRNQSSDSPVFYPSMGLYKNMKEVSEFGNDRVFVPSLTVEKGTPFGDITSVTSYFARNFSRQTDGTYYNDTVFSQLLGFQGAFGSYPIANGGAYPAATAAQLQAASATIAHIPSYVNFTTKYGQISQEIRIASNKPVDGDLPLRYTAGIYYSDQWNYHQNEENSPGLGAAFEKIYGVPIGSPDGRDIVGGTLLPGFDPAEVSSNLFANDLIFSETMHQDTRQLAAFGQLDYDILPTLHATAGLRYVYARDAYHRIGNGYYDISNDHDYTQLSHYYRATPKFSLAYDLTPDTSLYATAAEGFRLGGPTGPVPDVICGGDYANLSIKNASSKYGSDKLWSYEGGVKALLDDRTLSINSSVYFITWKDIQQRINLPICGFNFITNVGNAQSWGGETEIKWKPRFATGLTLSASGNAGKSIITKSLVPGIAQVGEHVLFTPDWTLAFGAEYAWSITEEVGGFVRGDYTWNGKSHGTYNKSGSPSPCALNVECFSPNYSDPMYGILNASAGVDMGDMQIYLFAKNLANDQTIIQRPQVNTVITGYTVRPLTVGLSVAKQF